MTTQLAQRPSALQLMAELAYEPTTGLFRWRRKNGQRGRVGEVAGCPSNEGYIVIRFQRKAYKAHRLAWVFTHGEEPEDTIDHIDGDRSNNRIRNLRLATKMENSRNSKIRTTNRSGHKGVCWHKRDQKWRAQICVNYRTIFLGSFNDVDSAAAAYREAAIKYHGQFSKS